MTTIASIEQLEALYGKPGQTSLVKELDHIIPEYAAFIEASPFVALATSGPDGLDCSPRGDLAGFVRIHDPKTIMMPDRRGNNRADSLKNIILDGTGWTFIPRTRLGHDLARQRNGRDFDRSGALCFVHRRGEGRALGIVMTVDAVYFQCARAIHRSELWNPAKHVDPDKLPSPGKILAVTSKNAIDGAAYDGEWPERAKKSMW